MINRLGYTFRKDMLRSFWCDQAPIRSVLFSVERLEEHAQVLAETDCTATKPMTVMSLHHRLDNNANTLLTHYLTNLADLKLDSMSSPASEWLLDNYHVVETQVNEIRDDLPKSYYDQLPKLSTGYFAGYPRVLSLAWAFVAHTDSHLDPEILSRFIAAYQKVQPLTIGELWAISITLRIVLIENLRRLADQMTTAKAERMDANTFAQQLLVKGCASTALETDLATRSVEPLGEDFAAQLAKRLSGQDPMKAPALDWLEKRLNSQGSNIDTVVQSTQQRQGASNVTTRNLIASMRLISSIDWAELFEKVSLVDQKLAAVSPFATMDFVSRNLYRDAIEQLARGSDYTEIEIVDLALAASAHAQTMTTNLSESERIADPGYHLIAEGRTAFEHQIHFKPSFKLRLNRICLSLGIKGYIASIVLISALFVGAGLYLLAMFNIHYIFLIIIAIISFIPTTELTLALMNRMITWHFGAITLPGLALEDGIPESLRTMVVIPTLLTNEQDLLTQVERLEVHYLSGSSGDLTFALLVDGMDAPHAVMTEDTPLLLCVNKAINQLNQRHGDGACGNRFLLLYRQRLYNSSEHTWMGWERKRGKLHELNRLLRGATDTSFIAVEGINPVVPSNVRYVITLDADTEMPRETANRLIGKMAHPLNRPVFKVHTQHIISGYAILQPRVTPLLSMTGEGSHYQNIFSSLGGMDPYAGAISDVYQDLFGEGSYTGKGIYDIDAFERALGGLIPENTLLSHDLLEGVLARAGLVSDIEVVEIFPSRYDVISKRQHRWTRGDWQLLPWLLGTHIVPESLPLVGRWKMLDNLRRSLAIPLTLLSLSLCWLLPFNAALIGLVLMLSIQIIPRLLPAFCLLTYRRRYSFRYHLTTLFTECKLAASQILLKLTFLADESAQMLDAIIRTLLRLYRTRQYLLEWTTAAQSMQNPAPTYAGYYRNMRGGCLLAFIIGSITLTLNPLNWLLITPFILLWLVAPIVAFWVSQPLRLLECNKISSADALYLRLATRRTWRYFEEFVTSEDNMLPPDNFQEDPHPIIAHRTSPTNIGLYLLSTIAVRDFGWAGTLQSIERLETTFNTLHQLLRFKGHFYNWYDTQHLKVLEPAYISSVDSGNFAGHLITLANACEEWQNTIFSVGDHTGIMDTIHLARTAVAALPATQNNNVVKVAVILTQIEARLNSKHTLPEIYSELIALTQKAFQNIDQACFKYYAFMSSSEIMLTQEALYWIQSLDVTLREQQRDYLQQDELPERNKRLQVIADAARSMALAMDFTFLINPKRGLLSIGYSLMDNCLDSSCYDLLASEARLASLFAIAKGDIPTKHWFRLGRTATPIGNGSALVSWSGSMFEYLMPFLVMHAPLGSLLEQTCRLVVGRQIAYADALNIPWGISESAYNARDVEFTYQYSTFGIPGLGLKRGLADNIVISPYATALASMVNAVQARQNFDMLEKLGATGRYGFFEALDFTPSRLPDEQSSALVYNFMAHHQGMSIVAIANTLNSGIMRHRFHREPIIQACALLLQERIPNDVLIIQPLIAETSLSKFETNENSPVVRCIQPIVTSAPTTHLLSNGRYAVMLTATGSGYSHWYDIAVTRWQADTTCDDWGSFIFIFDCQSQEHWSASAQPVDNFKNNNRVLFGEDYATFIRYDGRLKTRLDVIVSGEDDSEVRRVSLTNMGRRTREMSLTSYAELVLATVASDNAHPAFSKLFVVTEYLAELGALIATRRQRSPTEPSVWAAHFAVVEGDIVAAPQYESNRAHFFGGSHEIINTDVVSEGKALSNTVGTVLDPIFSIRQTIRITPGQTMDVNFWTVIASSREVLLDLIDKHRDNNAFDRAKTLAWTQAQVQLRHLGITATEAATFQQLAAPILYADSRFRASSTAIIRGAAAQSGLWTHSISGDLPIVLLRIDSIQDISQVRQLLRAHEYWRLKRLNVDLVIINEQASSYVQDLQIAIETAVRTSQSLSHLNDTAVAGNVYTLRADLMRVENRSLLEATARIVLLAHQGKLAEQLIFLKTPTVPSSNIKSLPLMRPDVVHALPDETLEFYNGLGGFAKAGREYVIYLDNKRITPMPWINVVANPCFGFQASAEGSGYTWSENSRENQITQWSNDPIKDPTSEAFYIRDEESLDLWSATAAPIRDSGIYIARHGFGYCTFEHQRNGISATLCQYVPLHDSIKISRLTLHNHSGRTRYLSVTSYVAWVLGSLRSISAPFVISRLDPITGALLAENPWNINYSGRVSFSDLSGKHSHFTADRTEFLGRNGSLASPAALATKKNLAQTTGAGFDPCAVLQQHVVLAAGESIEIVSFIGQSETAEQASALILKYRTKNLDIVFEEVTDYWSGVLETVQVKTPDRAMDIMLNGWLMYQTLACRIFARSAFYQSSGAYGFRDQLQDGIALIWSQPQLTRQHIIGAAGRQFSEGDVQHWWLPHSGQGVRTHISDDRVWLAFTTATYIGATNDIAILDENIPFITGPKIQVGHEDAFFQPLLSDESASLFEHCARGIEQCIALTGTHGLPLMGGGDWNDGMNRVGAGGQGESVWLGWLLVRTIAIFAPLAPPHALERVQRWISHAASVHASIEREAWDGQWYRRATFDDGSWLGSKGNNACQIDAIAQSWSVLSQAGDSSRAHTAMNAVSDYLINKREGLSLLFSPPFEKTSNDPGYINGYPAGLRENGGQYTHAAMWNVLAFAKLGAKEQAHHLFSLLNPINHALNKHGLECYKVEPYVVAADVYSAPAHLGRGGWTWYTGSAAWMYRAGIEGILGLSREGDFLAIEPCLPADWTGFSATVNIAKTRYYIVVSVALEKDQNHPLAYCDDILVECNEGVVRVKLDNQTHQLVISL